jgi:hypothetical protein
VTDRIIVLRTEDPLSFVADASAALAAAVNEPHAWSAAHDELVGTYAGMVRTYANLLRPMIAGEVQLRVIDHLLDRLAQAERGEILVAVTEIADRLHGELAGVLTPS